MPQCALYTAHAFGQLLVCSLLLVVLVVLGTLVQSTNSLIPDDGWLASDYPDPGAQPPQDCGFGTDPNNTNRTTWVCDPDRVLSIDEAILLGDYLRSLIHASPCDCQAVQCPGSEVTPTGYLIGVALVDRLNIEGMKFEPINVKAAIFAKATREKWFADLGCHDNALVLYSRFSNELYISIGEETEGVVSDLELASLYRLGDEYFPADDSSPASRQDEVVDSGRTAAPGHAALYDGLVAVVGQLDEAIRNGPSLSSDVVFAFAIPVLLLAVLTVMCLISNLWCAQDITLPEPSSSRRRNRSPQPVEPAR